MPEHVCMRKDALGASHEQLGIKGTIFDPALHLDSFVAQTKQTMICRIKRIVSLLSFSVFLSCHIHDGLSQGANLAPSPESSNCDKFKYEEWLKMQEKEGGDTNQQALDKLETSCRKQLDDLTRQMFGPPTLYKRWTVACNTECLEWDQLSTKGRGISECKCEELENCEDTPMFWLCKYMYECREEGITTEGLEMHRFHFCDGCGTGQITEVEFYEELDCGSGYSTRNLGISSFIATILWNIFVLVLN